MSRDELERALHDYLDGRMSAPERASFEAQLAGDRRLAERLEHHRDIGRALRSPLEGPRPGYAARARARYESTQQRRVGWGRLLRWEAAGMVAAGVILALLILPSQREGIPPAPIAPLERVEPIATADDSLASTQHGGAPQPSAPPAIAPRQDRFATGKELPRAAVEESDSRLEKKNEALADEAGAAVAGFQQARMKAVGESAVGDRFVALPPGSISDGAIELFRADAIEASTEISERTRNSILELQPIRGSESIVLIGPRPIPVSCAEYEIEITELALRILLASPALGRPAATGGCAIVVPSTTLPIVVEDPADARQ